MTLQTTTLADDPNGRPMISAADLAKLRAEMLAQFEAGTQQSGPIPFAEFKAEFLAMYKPPHRAKATYSRMRHVLELAGDLIGPAGTTADLTTHLVGRFITGRPPAERPHTTKSLLATLRTACSYAATLGYVRVSPFALRKRWIRLTPVNDDRQRHHALEDIARVLDKGRETLGKKVPGSFGHFIAFRTYALAAVAAYTGMRKMEIIRLWIEDIDIAHRMIRIVERQGNVFKTVGSAVPVAMPDALAAILAEYLEALPGYDFREPSLATTWTPAANPTGKREGEWAFPNGYRSGPWIGGSPGRKPLDRLKRLGARAGVEGFTFLSLRHSWATHAESRWGFTEAQIQRQLRHTTTKTQKSYRHADATNMRTAMQGIGFGEGPPPAVEVPTALPLPVPVAVPVAPSETSRPRRAKLDEADVVEARELRARGWTYAQLEDRYGVSKGTLHAMLSGHTHRHVPQAEEA